MRNDVSLGAVGHATSLCLAITYTLCVGLDLAFPQHAKFEAWRTLLPGFEWLTWKGFGIDLTESYGYGWYFGLIWVPLYYVVSGRSRSN